MMRWLKNCFVAREAESREPHLLRSEVVAGMLILVISAHLFVLLSAFVISPRGSYIATLLPNVLVDLTNERRETERVGDLKYSEILARAAQLKAEDMAEKGYFSHNSPDGKNPWYWLKQVGYTYTYAGENLAVNFFDSEEVVNAWMNSPTHRANLLNDKFTEVGIATARGTYDGRDGIFVVQFFGRPAVAKAATAPPPPAAPKPVSQPAKPAVQTTAPAAPVSEKPAPAATKPSLKTETSVAPKPEPIAAVPPASSEAAPEAAPTPVPTSIQNVEQGSSKAEESSIATEKSPLDLGLVPEDMPALSGTIQKLLVMPSRIAESLYLVIGALVFLSLFLHFLFSLRGRHRSAMVNGAVLLVIIVAVLFVDKLIVIVQAKVL